MADLKSVNDADYENADGSMNARQYHAWLWAQVPSGISDAKRQHVAKVIDRLTLQFMDGAAEDIANG